MSLHEQLSGALGGGDGFNFGFTAGGINQMLTFLVYMVMIAIVGYGIYWYRTKYRTFNIVIRGHDLRGDHDFEFDDMAKEVIAFNKSTLLLRKRKNANVIIPNLKHYRSMVGGKRVIHIFKFGAVNDYVVLDPQIVMDMEKIPLVDNEGKPLLEDGKPRFIERPKYELHVTDSLSKEHAIRDLRDAWARFETEDKLKKYSGTIGLIIVGVVMIASAWIYGRYMLISSENFLEGIRIGTEALTKYVEFTAGGGIS